METIFPADQKKLTYTYRARHSVEKRTTPACLKRIRIFKMQGVVGHDHKFVHLIILVQSWPLKNAKTRERTLALQRCRVIRSG